MKKVGFGLSMLRPVRFVIVAITCALLFFSNTVAASATVGTNTSNPKEATTQLLETQKRTDEASAKPPLSAEDQIEATKGGGLNEIQGTADIEKMKRPENSRNATTVEDEVKNLLNKVTGND
ncbi:hypothetical protein F7734_44655 [Scytonema sp. UIC 10036]|uniref:hypothetical protein n=1 Tax=Scytonema sp. UIC 10036 TaxID=2304196 RepID=UPI0012DAE972|nr:hypothetical protein [Scytonema sp. UIC 10036]MUG99011.1 hypothetical protein [Scytonema sp. UIC 10036]